MGCTTLDVVLDAGPLIFLAKLDAFDVFTPSGWTGVVPESVYAEAARPGLSFRYPEIPLVERARSDGRLWVISPDQPEADLAIEFGSRTSGLHAGELDVLALGATRGWPVCFHERQAARLARALGLDTLHLVELLAAGTPDRGRLEDRIRRFARLTNLAMDDLDTLLRLNARRHE